MSATLVMPARTRARKDAQMRPCPVCNVANRPYAEAPHLSFDGRVLAYYQCSGRRQDFGCGYRFRVWFDPETLPEP